MNYPKWKVMLISGAKVFGISVGVFIYQALDAVHWDINKLTWKPLLYAAAVAGIKAVVKRYELNKAGG